MAKVDNPSTLSLQLRVFTMLRVHVTLSCSVKRFFSLQQTYLLDKQIKMKAVRVHLYCITPICPAQNIPTRPNFKYTFKKLISCMTEKPKRNLTNYHSYPDLDRNLQIRKEVIGWYIEKQPIIIARPVKRIINCYFKC